MKKLHFRRKKTIDERIADGVDKEVREAKREWKHLKKFSDENYLLLTAFVILLAAAIIINTVFVLHSSSNENKQKAPETSTSAPDGTKFLTSHQVGKNSVLEVRVSSVTETDKIDRAFTILPTETMLILNISITNKSAETQQLIPVNQLYIRSDEGDYSALHASSHVTSPLAATELAPGKTSTGQISFNVPKRLAHPLLYIDTGWNKTVPLVYDILY